LVASAALAESRLPAIVVEGADGNSSGAVERKILIRGDARACGNALRASLMNS
jgi:hypothetical protein